MRKVRENLEMVTAPLLELRMIQPPVLCVCLTVMSLLKLQHSILLPCMCNDVPILRNGVHTTYSKSTYPVGIFLVNV